MKTDTFNFGYMIMGILATSAMYAKTSWWVFLPATIIVFIFWILSDAKGVENE